MSVSVTATIRTCRVADLDAGQDQASEGGHFGLRFLSTTLLSPVTRHPDPAYSAVSI